MDPHHLNASVWRIDSGTPLSRNVVENLYNKTETTFDDECDPSSGDVCTSDLSCERINGTTPNLYKCICQDDNHFWDSSLRTCRNRTGLQGIYVKDRMNITDAIAICENDYEGQLATEEHRLHVFPNCMDFAEEIWVIDTTYFIAENLSESCAKLNQVGELKIGSCTERKAFVCISKKNNQNDPPCVAFPTTLGNSFLDDSSKSSAGLIGGLLAASIILAGVLMLVVWLNIRRRRNDKCNMDATRVGNQVYDLDEAAYKNAIKMESRSVVKPEIRYEEEYDYATGAANQYTQDHNHLNIYANDQDASDVTEEQYETAGEVNQVYSLSEDLPDYANYTNDHVPPNDVSQHYSLKKSFIGFKQTCTHDDPSPSTDNLTEGEYNTFSEKHNDLPPSDTYDHFHNVQEGEYDHFQMRSNDQSKFTQHDDLPPSDTYDHVHNVHEGEYDHFQMRSSDRSNFTQDDENGYMQSTFPV
ncbi:uncharacterized protein LOC117321739 [Pecten maximus]|uniref:uncharacterized protein LOC117321739 n=1 Tax=Pecten maximus TaxID=6579 RepID=UPI00145896EB|nr:uncharacterized protein LOC117321739 [Pecten maximus]